LLGLGVVLAGSGGALALARARSDRTDPTAEFTSTCSELCWMKQAEAQADADASAAQTGLDQAQQAWTNARNYLATQLRNDYLSSKYLRRGGTVVLTALGGPLAWGAFGATEMAAPDAFESMASSVYWNQQVNDALPGAQAQIDQIGSAAVEAWKAKLADATRRQSELFDGRHAAELKLVTLRAQHPDVTFPDCNCDG
jgi:hypothetical protein